MSDEKLVDGFGEVEKDAIGEIMNITMGSAATAVSNLLSAKVWITTPTVTVISAKDLSFPELEPSIMVRIKYIQGVSGQNVLVSNRTTFSSFSISSWDCRSRSRTILNLMK